MTYHLQTTDTYGKQQHLFKDFPKSDYLLIWTKEDEPFLIVTSNYDVLNYVIKRIRIKYLNSDNLPGIEGRKMEGNEGLLTF